MQYTPRHFILQFCKQWRPTYFITIWKSVAIAYCHVIRVVGLQYYYFTTIIIMNYSNNKLVIIIVYSEHKKRVLIFILSCQFIMYNSL